MRVKCFVTITLAFLSFSCAQKDHTVHDQTERLKLTPVVFGGNRYVVQADFGLDGKVPLMIHGNVASTS